MNRRDFLRLSALAAGSRLLLGAGWASAAEPKRPNILFITFDDMNCDSVGVFGCKVKNTTPTLDRFAGEGIRFEYAHVQAANCVPSRNVMQTGRYPHTSGVEGFYKVHPDFPILPDLLKEAGYYIGILNKVGHSTPYQPFPWDLIHDAAQVQAAGGKGAPAAYSNFLKEGIAAARAAGKPFYLVANVNDPHTPFYGMGKGAAEVADPNRPTHVFTPDEIVVPGFLPDTPDVRKELAHYYSSVRRADDDVAAMLETLAKEGLDGAETVVMMLSDHGMPFPFAKTCVYHHSTHTPWMVRWPGTVKAGAVDSRHMISAIDFAPTILEIAGLPVPEAMQGRSFLPLLRGETQDGRDFVIKEYNENSGAWRHPMRSVQTRQYGYIFNPWSNGKRKFETATNGMLTAREMIRLAKTDAKAAERLRLFQLRVVEEFYDYANDPDALNNLIDDPAMQGEIDKLRGILETWMEETGDHCLEPFRRRGDPAFLNAYVEQKQAESDARRNKGKAQAKPAAKRDDLIALILPRSAMRGKSSFVTVHHTIPEELGKQKIHVTLKDAAGARIERKIQTVGGTGDAKFEFAIPDDANLKMVSFAAFIGEEFPVCLQHINSNNLPVN